MYYFFDDSKKEGPNFRLATMATLSVAQVGNKSTKLWAF